MQNVFEVWEFKENWLKILILGDLGSIQVFWKAFYLILMHSIHKILCFKVFLHKAALFFKNLIFQDFRSIKGVFLTNWKCDYNFGLNLSELIAARLLLDQSNVIFDQSNLIFDQSKIALRVFLKLWVFTCSVTFKLFQKLFLSLFDRSRIQAQFFVIFPQFVCKIFVF